MPHLAMSGSGSVEVVSAAGLPELDPADTEPPAMSAQRSVKQRDARLRRLVDTHIDFIGRVLRNAGTPAAEIDDAVQRTFIAAARRLDDMRPGAEKSFLLQIALHVAAHARRSAARRREVPAAEPPDVVDSATPEQLTSQKHARQMLDQVLDQMETDLRTVFVLYEFEEMSMVEIAGVLSIPQGTVASRLRRARADFRERVRALELVSGSEVKR
jgi:RNA polymerase sigma-70 factor (ECF subfamily)